MSTYNVSSIPRISSSTLSQTILQSASPNLDAQTPPEKLAIIDVRDDDHIGGHIKHSTHVPSSTLDHKIPELVRKLKDKDVVVFHCALSQVRGPKAALQYLRERERLVGLGGGGGGKTTTADGNGEGEKEGEVEEKTEQQVYVLERGFVEWQERFGEDSRLTEGYRKEIWKEGYWM